MATFDTRSVHAGEPDPRIEGAVTLPIFPSTTYTREEPDDELQYIRYSNSPTHSALHDKLSTLTRTESALVTASGMAAISSALLTLLSAGDHFVTTRGLYGGTLNLFEDFLPQFNIHHSFLSEEPASWDQALRPETKVLYAESISNPLLTVPDLEAMANFAETHELVAVIDNTFASPVNLRPATLGFDVVLHSATKYLGGHSDLGAGVVAGPRSTLDAVHQSVKLLGGILDPHACYLLYRSLKTLGPRVRQQNGTAQALAETLERNEAVARVRYPGLSTHPDHERAQSLLDGSGGMISFTLAPSVHPEAFMEALSIPIRAPSLGGVETLLTRPIQTSHKDVAPAVREELGITERFMRLSIGLEGIDDLTTDLTRALESAMAE